MTRKLILLLTLAALWGPSFLFIKVALEDVPPLTIMLSRVAIGAAMLLLVLRLQGRRVFPRSRTVWRHMAVLGLVQNALPFVLLGWAELYIDSALASILNGFTPIFTIIFAHFLVADDRLSGSKIAGVVLGFGGLAFLVLPSLLAGVQATTFGLLAAVGAAVSYGIAIVYARNNARGMPPLVAPANQLLMATLYLLPFSLLFDQPWTLGPLSLPSLASLLALGFFGTGLAFVLYYRLQETAEPTFISMVTYIVPVFGVILGVVVLDEQLTWNVYAGFGLILLGVMMVNGLARRFLPARVPASPG